MARYIAFLRAINVGGRIVKMAELRRLFEELGYTSVETFIASGQVIFQTRATDAAKLETKIEQHLRARLGYEVATFIRTPADLQQVLQCARSQDAQLYVAFTRQSPAKAAVGRLTQYNNEVDQLEVRGREVFWYARTTFSQSTFSGALLEKAIGMPATIRNINTIRRLADKYAE